MSDRCEIIEQAALPVLSIRTRTPAQDLPKVLGQSYGVIMTYLGELGEAPSGPPFTAYYNMDMQDLDVEVGFPVAWTIPSTDDVQAGEIPAGKYATCLYTGPYSEIGAGAYDPLSKFVEVSEFEATGVSYEMYLNDPTETDPRDLQTRVLFPLKRP